MTRNQKETIDRLSTLALLSLPASEHDSLMHDIDNILRYIQALETVDVEGVLPTTHATREEMIVRPDVVSSFPSHEELTRRAPARRDGHMTVKGIRTNGS